MYELVAGVNSQPRAIRRHPSRGGSSWSSLGVNLQTATPAPDAVTAASGAALKDTEMHANMREIA
jgi:hypothetical protein